MRDSCKIILATILFKGDIPVAKLMYFGFGILEFFLKTFWELRSRVLLKAMRCVVNLGIL